MQGTLRSPVTGVRGLIVVLPILGDDYGPSELFARHLSERGFATMRFNRKTELFDPARGFDHVARIMRLGVLDLRRGIRWAVENGVDGGHGVGVVGISMGAFAGTLLAATDEHVRASVLALGGGGLPSVLRAARSEEEIGAFYEALEARGWSAERIDAAAAEQLAPVEPLHFAAHLDPRRTLLLHAMFDQVVPYENGTALWEAAGRPERLSLLAGHYGAAIYLPYVLAATESFFSRHLGPGRRAGRTMMTTRTDVDRRPCGAELGR